MTVLVATSRLHRDVDPAGAVRCGPVNGGWREPCAGFLDVVDECSPHVVVVCSGCGLEAAVKRDHFERVPEPVERREAWWQR